MKNGFSTKYQGKHLLLLRAGFISLLMLTLFCYGQAQAFQEDSLPLSIAQKLWPKASVPLRRHIALAAESEMIKVELLTKDEQKLLELCTSLKAEVISTYWAGSYTYLVCNLQKEDLVVLLSVEAVLAAELCREASPELKQEGLDLSLNQITLLHDQRKELAGTGLTLSLKENSFDTTDIDFKGRYFLSALTSSLTQTHATNMASIAGGGGNSDPTAKGVAWDATLTTSNFDILLPDEDSYFEFYDITIQNHSYGTGIENYYGIETMAYDESCTRLPSLVHIFSSGNDGNLSPVDGTYAGLAGWANLTGQFKQSKNTITVGATDSLANVVELSSQGPAYDGRIKPEVVAYGHGGTSGAAAIVSGLALLMQERYKNIHANTPPPASLLKAILVNTAQDIGRPGPDFESGFGSVRGNEAIKAIEENQFEVGQMAQSGVDIIPVDIPLGISQFKVTLAWTDPAASIDATSALINDLDLELKNKTTGEIWRPWLLSTYPDPDSLALPARRGIDTINNIEQITLTFPEPGEYELRLSGDKIKSGNQQFSVTWHFEESNAFQWVFPTGSDYLKPASNNILRWNGRSDLNGKIEYKPVGQQEWLLIAAELDPAAGSIYWHTPVQPGLRQLRWTNTDTFFVSDTFVLGDALRPKVGFLCPDSLMFYWRADEVADSFQILSLGARHLEYLDFTTDTFFIRHAPEEYGYHYAVTPIYAGYSGPNSYGFDYHTQGAGCYINTFFLRYVQDGTAYFEADLGTLYNVESVILEKWNGDVYTGVDTNSPVTDLQIFLESDELDQGANYFRLVVILENGTIIPSENVVVYHAADHDVLVFPNPVASDEIQILVKKNLTYTLKILDLLGKEVINLTETSNPQPIDVSGLAAGQYIVFINFEDGGREAGKFVVRQ